jgi:type I restriction-modification system DNA methylase subunit
MDLIRHGIEKGLISFDDEKKYITYLHQNKRRNYSNPEEQVQAETFLKLVLVYGYPAAHIRHFVTVQMGSSCKEADMVVYNDVEQLSPYIVVECKKQEANEAEYKQAVEQGFSYAVPQGATYVWITSGSKNTRYQLDKKRPNARITIGNIPKFGEGQPPPYQFVKEGLDKSGRSFEDLNILTEAELTQRFKQAHNSLWGGGELNPSEAFDELDKLIFCKIWDEKNTAPNEPYQFQVFADTDDDAANRTLMQRVRALYLKGRERDPEVFKDNIRLTPEKLRTVVGYLENINLGDTDLDSKGRAFETFMGSFFRGDFGQYFTPRPIVEFIVSVLPITNESLVLDTSCGSGGFLLHALDKVRKQADERYPNKKSDLKQGMAHHKFWHDFAENNLFGIEINEQIARTAKMNMIIHDDGHTNVIAADGLLPSEKLLEKVRLNHKTNPRGFTNGNLDFIVTNPPFGSSVKQTESAYMHQYGLALKKADWLNPTSVASTRPNQSTEVLFIEQCHNFLKEGGYLAMVVPDGILTNSSLQYVRDDIEERYRIVAVVSMPQTAFQATGAGVKSSVLFLKKHTKAMTDTIKNRKTALQDTLKKSVNFEKEYERIENLRGLHIRTMKGFNNPDNLKGKALTDTPAYKEWKAGITAMYREQIDALKEKLEEQYAAKQASLVDDYPIFMAIAEDIGYDATGKPLRPNNDDTQQRDIGELRVIGVELARFIQAIERGEA